MTSFVCENCGLWIGTEYKGNENWKNHICEAEKRKKFEQAKEEYKKEFQEKIDFVDLNSKKSLLRTVNCERSIQLIERKLEQIRNEK